MEYDEIQRIYTKICAGYDFFSINGQDCYFKHHFYSDRVLLKEKHKQGIEIAKRNGIKTEKDYLEFYINKGWWSKSKEDDIRTTSTFIENLKKSREKLFLPSQKESISKTIEEEEDKLSHIISEKRSIIPITAEEYADKYYNRYYLYYSLFKDREFNIKFADNDDYFVEIDDYLYSEIWEKIFSIIDLLKVDNIKYIAATGFFQNLLMLCGKEMSAFDFYGKPVTNLTINQSDLFSYAASYRRSINNATESIPDYILSDPDNLISWCEGGGTSASQAKKLLERTPNQNKGGERSGRISSIVGATNMDYKKLGIEGKSSGNSDLLSAAEGSGGEMTINQVIKKTDGLK